MQYCADVPHASHLRLANASVPVCCLTGTAEYSQTIDALALVDIDVVDGLVSRIEAVGHHHALDSEWKSIDLRQGMVLPTFVDLHTHIGMTPWSKLHHHLVCQVGLLCTQTIALRPLHSDH